MFSHSSNHIYPSCKSYKIKSQQSVLVCVWKQMVRPTYAHHYGSISSVGGLSSCSTWGTTTIYKPGANQSRSPERDRSGSVNISLVVSCKSSQPDPPHFLSHVANQQMLWYVTQQLYVVKVVCVWIVPTYTNDNNSRTCTSQSVITYASVHTWHTVHMSETEAGRRAGG